MRFGVTYLLILLVSAVHALNSSELLTYKEKSSSNVIKLTKTNFQQILSGPSDSYILLLLTATNAQIGCAVCQSIQPEFNKLADSWNQVHPEGDGLYFARADFADGHKEIFQAFQLNNVPRLYLYSPSNGAHPFNAGYETLSVPQNPSDFAPYVAELLANKAGIQLIILEPVNYGTIITTAIVTILVFFAVRKNKSSALAILGSRPLWGGVAVFSILFFVSGYMYNTIRDVPYVRGGPDGAIQYFIKGQQSQMGAETQIMAFIYAILAFAAVSLVTRVNAVSDARVQLFVVSFILVLIVVFYSVLLSIFNFKSSGYPFHLLNIWSP